MLFEVFVDCFYFLALFIGSEHGESNSCKSSAIEFPFKVLYCVYCIVSPRQPIAVTRILPLILF